MQTLEKISDFTKKVGSLLVPYRCPGCGRLGDSFLCGECEKRIRRIEDPFCDRCGRLLPPGVSETADCRECRAAAPPYDIARSVFRYEAPVDDIIKKFKFGRNFTAGRWLGGTARDLAGAGFKSSRVYQSADAIVPVPLHPFRFISRGFNQSDYLARFFSELWEIPIAKCMVRKRHTRQQAMLSYGERIKNVSGAFAVKNDSIVKDGKLILFDDVMTTGATVKECAKILVEAGAMEVYVFTVARRP
ncbi:MAG TPA: ComF family protein [bacterium]|nr:ComF family protein [bacterium]